MAASAGILRFTRLRRSTNAAFMRIAKLRINLQNLPKYEGKHALNFCAAALREPGLTSPLNSRFTRVKASLILGNQFFSNMFTSYSHAPFFVPWRGLEIRNR